MVGFYFGEYGQPGRFSDGVWLRTASAKALAGCRGVAKAESATVERSCGRIGTGHIVPDAEGSHPERAVFGSGDEMAVKLKVRANVALGG